MNEIAQSAFKMKFVLISTLFFFAFAQLSLAISENAIEVPVPEVPLDDVADPAANPDQTLSMVEQMYRSTMVSVLKQKVMEVQKKVVKGENALPEAIDILKITLLSQPTNSMTIRRAAENVFMKISPQLGKAASSTFGLLEDTPIKTD
jgi:hypothetical protein